MIQVQACDKIGFGETMANFPGQHVNVSLTSQVCAQILVSTSQTTFMILFRGNFVARSAVNAGQL